MNISNTRDLIRSGIIKRLTLMFTGNIFAAGLGFLAVLIISRELSVSDFGLFNMAISVILISSRLSTLGMDTTMIKFASSYLILKKKAEVNYVLRTIFLVRIIISSILALVVFIASEIVSTKVFYHPGLTSLLKLAAFGGLTFSLLNYLKSVLHTYQLFRKSVILQIFIDLGKLFTVIVLIWYLKMSVFIAVAIFAFIPVLGIFLGFKNICPVFFSEKKPIQNLFKQLFSYSKWMFVSNTCNLILPYVGIFMISRMLSSEAAGIYGLAVNLTYIFPIIIYSLHSVLLPKVSRFREIAQFEKYIRDALKVSLYMGIIIVPFLFFSHAVIQFFFGSRYLGAVPVFNWFLLSYTILTVNTTLHVALYSMSKPYIIAIADVVNLMVMIIGCYILIPLFHAVAPALLMLIIHASNLGFFSLYILKNIRTGTILFHNTHY
ncbi:MAG: hypothetical protein DWB56_03845 [Candidatus Jettenia sp.]|nr:oligosaccharide flippase family protein [Candidatus Jettenia sp. AMX1]MBC6928094.1 hypothetical protein [Candidatus Jettenia sp.]NUN23506.1 oligosaccharide flippase family protein [Candidatus Jettenia caeni]KAA0251193.1 MAG: hypothetical protein EDM77_02520 [Candidatus Jettenia sp. AMX1]MCE7879265.1 hypothetical protein [Candidatus Jettenia sp. AMX1]MCQ3927509.1 hypothetical protein [Candidatus Jettenia sp.]